MYTGLLHTHKLVVILFLMQYLIKTVLLLINKTDALQNYSRKTKIPEMVVSVLFLLTGIYLAVHSGNIGMWLWVKLGAVFLSIPVAIIAFKNNHKGLAILSLLLIVYAYRVSQTKSISAIPEQHTTEFSGIAPEDLGRAIYDSRCINCHGSDGKSGLSGSKDLTASTLTHAEKAERITNGKNSMMGFKVVLSPEEIEAVTVYVESLKK